MSAFEFVGLLAQSEPEGDPIVGLLIIGAIIWACWAIFGGKKDRYIVTHGTSVRKVKS